MLFNDDVTIALGNKKIVNNSKITIDKNIKYCIIGQNGVGKTTVMSYIYEQIKHTINALYITQTENINESCTIFEYMLKADQKLFDKNEKYTKLEKYISSNDNSENITEEIFKEYQQLSDELKTDNYKKYESKILKILIGMGFLDEKKQVNLLSGGQQTKLALCKALLLEPELLLLDEPTNHLDLKNVIWLENYLLNYKKGVIVISHNIDFFDTFCDKLIYFFNIDPQNPQIYFCKGGYSNFIKTFDQKKNDYVKGYDEQCKKISLLKKSKDKTDLDRFMKKQQINRPIRDYDINIKFNKVNSLSSNEYVNVISLDDVNFAYDGINNVIENVNIGINLKSRYVLIGDNGSGKTTFFNMCNNTHTPTSGTITFDNRIRIGYFNQLSITQLPENLNPIQYLQYLDSSLDQQTCRAILSKVGFKKMYEGDDFNIEKLLISELSGGQKVKLVLCGIKIKNPHIILFDEPTNHLDIYTINEFIDSINEYEGGVVIITHDKYIIENIDNYKLLILENKQIIEYDDTFEEYCKNLITN